MQPQSSRIRRDSPITLPPTPSEISIFLALRSRPWNAYGEADLVIVFKSNRYMREDKRMSGTSRGVL